jgi:hypothetical protein
LTTAQAHALNSAQLIALTTDQIVALETVDIAAMSMAQSVAFATDDLAAMDNAQLDALLSVSPIVLDLNGNGVSTLAAKAGVQFDLAATGKTSQVAWVGQGDGLLVMDRNGDGVIKDGSELFGAATRLANGSRAGNGYNALAEVDSNHDGKISAQDAQFVNLKVWVDRNHDGKTDLGELKGLVDLGITELDLNYASSNRLDHGNAVAMVSSYKTVDGQTHEMADVWFAKSASGPAPKLDELLAAAPVDLVPASPAATHANAAAPQAGTAAAVPPHHVSLDEELLRHLAPLV